MLIHDLSLSHCSWRFAWALVVQQAAAAPAPHQHSISNSRRQLQCCSAAVAVDRSSCCASPLTWLVTLLLACLCSMHDDAATAPATEDAGCLAPNTPVSCNFNILAGTYLVDDAPACMRVCAQHPPSILVCQGHSRIVSTAAAQVWTVAPACGLALCTAVDMRWKLARKLSSVLVCQGHSRIVSTASFRSGAVANNDNN